MKLCIYLQVKMYNMKGSRILKETYTSLGKGSQYFVFKVKKLSWKQWLVLAVAFLLAILLIVLFSSLFQKIQEFTA